MKPLRGSRYFFYVLSAFGYALVLASLTAGAVAFYHPPLALEKAGLPRFLPPDLSGPLSALAPAALAGLLALLVFIPAAAFRSDRSRAGLGRRRVFLLAALLPLALSALLFFLPLAGASSPVNSIVLVLLAAVAGAAAACYWAPYLALGYEGPATEQERAALSLFQTAGLLGGILVPVALVPGFFTAFPVLGPAFSFDTTFLILVIAASLILCAAFFAVAEKRPLPAAEPAARRKEPLLRSILRAFRAAASVRPFAEFLRAEAAGAFALSLLALAAVPIGADLMLVDAEFLRLTVMGFLAAALTSLPAIRPLVNRLGKKKTMLIGLAGLATGLLLLAATGVFPLAAGLRWNCTTAAAESPDGVVYVGTRRGASLYTSGVWSQITRREGLIDDRINSLTADPNGVWFGTEGGASFYDGRAWTHYSKASGLLDNRVLGIVPRGKAVWFLTPRGVSLLENAQWRHYEPKADAPLTAFVLGAEGDLWLGSAAGAYRYNENGWTKYTTGNGLPDDTVTALAAAPNGDILFGTYRGLARRTGDNAWSYLNRENGLPANEVRALKAAPDGRVFIATALGVFASDGVNRRTLTRADGLAHDEVNDILFTRRGETWFATGNGVSVFANGRWTSHQYPLPWIWGLVLAILLGFPAALFVSLPRLFTAEAADALRAKTGERQEVMCFAVPFFVRALALLAAGLVSAALYWGGGESIAQPLPVRLLLLLAAASAGLAFVFYYRYPEQTPLRK